MAPALGQWVLLGGASLIAGAINSVAGGGSLLSFPAAMAAGMSPVVANATNAVGLTPGSLASAWAYRRELATQKRALGRLVVPAILGGLCGSALLLVTPQKVFDQVVPLLMLFATTLLIVQNFRKPKAQAGQDSFLPGPLGMALQFLLATYGGYFGAGMGIMMLALYDATGGGTLHEKNAVKTVLAGIINGAAAVWFLASGVVDIKAALLMTALSSVGGWVGAAVARKADPRVVRWVVSGIGLTLTIALAWKKWT